jgi:Ca2+-binding RTX toxin-like protein
VITIFRDRVRIGSTTKPFSNVSKIMVWGRGGDDTISAALVTQAIPVFIHGGAGRDTIIGAPNGTNSIFGGEGNDNLTGGRSNDLLAGGLGSDKLSDPGGHDIVLGVNITNQLTEDFLRDILAEWVGNWRFDGPPQFDDDVERFKAGLVEDHHVDEIFDSLGDDWYLLGQGDLFKDYALVPDRDKIDSLPSV